MEPWELHEMFPSLDITNILGYMNHISLYWLDNSSKFDGQECGIVSFGTTIYVHF
jgi:hypothetical protein